MKCFSCASFIIFSFLLVGVCAADSGSPRVEYRCKLESRRDPATDTVFSGTAELLETKDPSIAKNLRYYSGGATWGGESGGLDEDRALITFGLAKSFAASERGINRICVAGANIRDMRFQGPGQYLSGAIQGGSDCKVLARDGEEMEVLAYHLVSSDGLIPDSQQWSCFFKTYLPDRRRMPEMK